LLLSHPVANNTSFFGFEKMSKGNRQVSILPTNAAQVERSQFCGCAINSNTKKVLFFRFSENLIFIALSLYLLRVRKSRSKKK